MQKKNIDKNFAVIIYENGYPNVGGIATLLGIYPTHKAAALISKVVKERAKLPYYPIIEPTDFEPTTFNVESHLEKMDELKRDTNKNQ